MSIDGYFEQQGRGDPIVFIHGSFASTSTWKRMVEVLSKDHHCISIKLPGHCGMPDPLDFSSPTIHTEINIIRDTVTALTDKPVHLVGHSVGASIALAIALKSDLKLSKMTLFEPVSIWVLRRANNLAMTQRVDDFLSHYRQDARENKPYVCGQVIDFWAGNGAFDTLPLSIQDSMQPLVKNNLRHWDMDIAITSTLSDLEQCEVTTHLVYGDQSNPVAGAVCEQLNESLPNSTKHVIKGANHFLVTSHVEECLRYILD
ncbi:alpha/beta hydrolase [Vibrio sp. 10N.261.55.A7]|uniref:alpha/beta fold hydrolase n=1 Tax=Vibrio sp. 10N.261.55.A7 TaxID=1880851 RepID=UPI000C856F42|nr:alpha/beta hydrolase [Vibrio sp. 10N.261.55.A7]PMJ91716.1 alpha/beta hydrolase [Vibrio sp. 10N.261.55.A7]